VVADPLVEDAQLGDLTHFVEGEQVDAMTTSKLDHGGIVGSSQNTILVGGGYMIEHETGPVGRPGQGSDLVAGVMLHR
jgi:hypothetical protein